MLHTARTDVEVEGLKVDTVQDAVRSDMVGGRAKTGVAEGR